MYHNCQECKYREILQEPETGELTGELTGHSCVIYPERIYEDIRFLQRDQSAQA